MNRFFYFLMLLLPFQLALSPSENIDLASIRLLILILFFWWLMRGLFAKRLTIPDNWQSFFVIVFLGLSFFSIFFAKNPDWSWRKMAYLLSIFPIFFVAQDILNNREKIIKTARMLVIGATVVSFVGLVQFFSQFFFGQEKTFLFWSEWIVVPFLGEAFGEAVLKNPSWLVNISGQTYLRATSIFPDPHMLAFYLGLIFPLAGGLFVAEKKTPLVYLLMGSVILLTDLLTFSRGSYIALAAAFLVVIPLFWKKLRVTERIILLIIIVSGISLITIPSPISQRFFSSFDLREGSNVGRLEMWDKSLSVIQENLFWGTGIGNYPLEVDPTADYRDPIYAHNSYLDVAVETGVTNALVWIGILIGSLTYFFKKGLKDAFFFGPFFSLILFSVHSLVETPIYSPVVLTTFLVIIAFVKKDDFYKKFA